MITQALKNAARQPFFSLFMDGRNEYGTHLLSLPGASIVDETYVMGQFSDPKDGFSESVFQEAEKLGYQTGNAIVTLWRYDQDDWFEYQGISSELTELLWGTPKEQREKSKEDTNRG